MSREEVLADVGSLRWGDFKPRLADALVAHLGPIQQRYHEVMRDEGALDAILAKVSAIGRSRSERCCTLCPVPNLLTCVPHAGRGCGSGRGICNAGQREESDGLQRACRRTPAVTPC